MVDALHPDGRCECAGEGRCTWCRTHCQGCGVQISEVPLPWTPRECPKCAVFRPPPRITHVAIRYPHKVYSLPAPNRHHHVLLMIADENHGVGIPGGEQGFLDASGRFLHREDALDVARANGQLIRQELPSSATNLGRLFSEDLW